jgi:putative hydrolase of the HAD superfamily
MQIKAVLFDMFDTLMIIEKDHAFYNPAVKSMHQYLAQRGVPVTFPVFRDAYMKARDEIYEKADKTMEEPHFNQRIQNALEQLCYIKEAHTSQLIQGATDAFCKEFTKYVRIDEHAISVLKQLHGKYVLGIVSNFAIPECVINLLEQHEIAKLFDVIVVSGAVNKRKPHPDIFHLALEKLALDPIDSVFVGDTVDADIKGAKDAGMRTVYIDRRPQKELEQVCPDQTIKSLSQLPTALEKF